MVLTAGRISEPENLVTLLLEFSSSMTYLAIYTPPPHSLEEFWQQSLLLVFYVADWWMYHVIALMEVHALSSLETV